MPESYQHQGRARLAPFILHIESAVLVLYAASLVVSITVSGVLLILGLLLWAIRTLFADKPWERNFLFKPPPLSLPLALFVLSVTISGALAPSARGHQLGDALSSLNSLRLLIVYFWAFHNLKENPVLGRITIQSMLVFGTLAGILGAIQQLADFHPFGYHWLQGTGFLGAPMAYAGEMQILSMIALAFLVTGSYPSLPFLQNARVFLGVSLANALGLIFAAERSAWLGATFGVLALAGSLSRKLLLKAIALILLLALLLWLFVPVVHTRLEPLLHWQNDVSSRVRFQIWEKSLSLWQKSPVFGIGICHFPRFAIAEAVVPGRSHDLNHAHSNYIHILTTCGLLGLVTFIWLHLAALHLAWQNFKLPGKSPPNSQEAYQRALALGILASVVALMISGIFEYNFGTSQVRQMEWFVLAFLTRRTCREKTKA